MAINPIDIPIEIDDPVSSAKQACGSDPLATLPKETAKTRQASHQMAAADAQASRAGNARLPDLQAYAQFSGNDVNSSNFANTFADTVRFRYPAWTLGMRVSFPILSFQERADQIQANSSLIRADAEASDALSKLKLNWINDCLAIQRLTADVLLQEENYKDQIERAKLEENRFDLGRSTLTQVIQAQDDVSNANLALRASQAELRLASWRIRRLHDGMRTYREHLDEVIRKEKAI
jgi:outer membrane protein TolC